jgi:tungstate transport system substrate-binding protein
MKTTLTYALAGLLALALVAAGCAPAATATVAPTAAPATVQAAAAPGERQVLRLATTTSTADSGLLDAILPDFEARHHARVDVVAVGTGQAIGLGASGDADVILVHARAREEAFVEAGDGVNRLEVMYNDFILVGPADDPAGVAGTENIKDALAAIAAAEAPFASRGDDSGSHTKELSLWASTGMTPTTDSGWYLSLGQGMGETLQFANERPAYTLSDRATWLAQQANLPSLGIIFGGATIADNPDPALYNPYGVIPVNPDRHPGVNYALATQFAEWITSVDIQQLIEGFGQDQFGQALFHPSSEAWKAANQ